MATEPPQTSGRVTAVRRPAPRVCARATVLCFPHAGGAASHYRAWAVEAPWDVEFAVVQYPGREDRYAEAAPTDMADLVRGLAAELLSEASAGPCPPTVLFGHSMGAAVAYEVARLLAAADRPPAHLVVSGRPAPALSRAGSVHLGTDEDLVRDLRRLGGTGSGVLADTALMTAVLPTIRRDYRLIETYRPLPGVPLRTPVTVLRGDRDPEVDAAEADAWREATAGPCRTQVFPGDHFYLESHREQIVALLVAETRAACTPAAWNSMP